jgi:glutamyl-tRNA reductase
MEDAILVHLMHGAIRAGRRARAETAIGHHALSVSSIAARRARDLHPRIAEARVLVIGAGEAGRLTAEALVDQGVSDMLVANRTRARAEALASELGGRVVPFEELAGAIATCDVIVAASGAPGTLVDLELMRDAVARREGAPLIVIDIGVPRDCDPAVASLPGVSYYDMDGLQEIAAVNAEARAGEIPAVEAILSEETADFVAWWESLRSRPTIASLSSRAEAIRGAALEKALRRLPADDELRREVDALTRTIVKRILHDPIATLRQRGDREQHYIEAVRTLFQLDEPPAEDGASDTDGS